MARGMVRWTVVWVAALCSCSALAQQQAPDNRGRNDDREARSPYTISLFDRPLELGLNYEVKAERQRNFDLDAADDRDRTRIDQELKLQAKLKAGKSVTLFAELVGISERRKRTGERTSHLDAVERGQAWLRVDDLGGAPLALQIGRVPLAERRSWWWDEDLDAARVTFEQGPWRIDTGVGREVARQTSALQGIDPEHKRVTRWFGQASYRWAQRHSIDAFWLRAIDRSGAPQPGREFVEDDIDESDPRLTWLGLRASGETRFESGHRVAYRADLATVRGRDTVTAFDELDDGPFRAGASTGRRVRGHAFDLGATWSLPLPARPSLSLALAQGSGGADGARTDRNFRQTGLQENEARIGGVKRLRYYGQLLAPELSNLRIASAGLGVRVLENSSIELLLHRYRQRVASTRLADSRLSEDPAGASRDIGSEIDLFVALREWQHVEFSFGVATFRPGAAFAPDRRDRAYGIELGAEIQF